MLDLIHDFVKNTLFSFTNADLLAHQTLFDGMALLTTIAMLMIIFYIIMALIIWAFRSVFMGIHRWL